MVRAGLRSPAKVRARTTPEAGSDQATGRRAPKTLDRVAAERVAQQVRAMALADGTRREREAVPAPEQAPHPISPAAWASAVLAPTGRAQAGGAPGPVQGLASDLARGPAQARVLDRAAAERQAQQVRAMALADGIRREREAVPAPERAPHLISPAAWASAVLALQGKAQAVGAPGLVQGLVSDLV